MQIALISAYVALNPQRVTPSGFINRVFLLCYKRFTPSGFYSIAESIVSITRCRGVIDIQLQRRGALLPKVLHWRSQEMSIFVVRAFIKCRAILSLCSSIVYFFFALFLSAFLGLRMAALAAARRAIGIRKGEHET